MGTTRLSVFFDGFNVYHSIKALIDDGLDEGGPVKWLNLAGLAESFLHQIDAPGRKEIAEIHYFSALASHKVADDPEHVKHHQLYLRSLKASGIDCHLHRFKKRHRNCKHCGKPVKFHEEKETDVAIAARLIQVFAQDTADVAVIVSGDTDMAPAVRTVFDISEEARIWFGFPYKRKNKELSDLVRGRGGSFKINPKSYRKFIFPDPVVTRRGTEIRKPADW